MPDQLEQSLRDALSQRAGQLDPDSIARLRAIDYHPRRRRIGKLPAIGALGATGVAAAAAAIVTLASSAAPAFAGWQPTPSSPAPGQLAQAVQACGQDLGSPVLADSRGPYTASIYADSSTSDVCLSGNGVSMSSRSTSVAPASVAAGQIQVGGGGTRDAAGNALTVVEGRTGAGVAAVTIERSDGSSVPASVASGWYLGVVAGHGRGDERRGHDAFRDQHRGVPVDAAAAGAEVPVRGPLRGWLLVRQRRRQRQRRASRRPVADGGPQQQRELVPVAVLAPPGVARKPPPAEVSSTGFRRPPARSRTTPSITEQPSSPIVIALLLSGQQQQPMGAAADGCFTQPGLGELTIGRATVRLPGSHSGGRQRGRSTAALGLTLPVQLVIPMAPARALLAAMP
jgi:hypothetical protein